MISKFIPITKVVPRVHNVRTYNKYGSLNGLSKTRNLISPGSVCTGWYLLVQAWTETLPHYMQLSSVFFSFNDRSSIDLFFYLQGIGLLGLASPSPFPCGPTGAARLIFNICHHESDQLSTRTGPVPHYVGLNKS